jgi:hypothetical protein
MGCCGPATPINYAARASALTVEILIRQPVEGRTGSTIRRARRAKAIQIFYSSQIWITFDLCAEVFTSTVFESSTDLDGHLQLSLKRHLPYMRAPGE